jgi:lysophospholipase L1-like esterase
MRTTISLFFIIWVMQVSTTAQITNQNLYDTLPTMVAHYEKRLGEFRSETVEKGKIIFLGNSITEGGQWHQLTDNKSRINRGIGGDVTFGIMNRLDEIVSREPSKIFIMIGINDISKDFPDVVIADNYKKIIRELKLKLPSVRIYIQSILPVNPMYPKFPQHYDKSDHVILVNKLLQTLAVSEKVNFINLYPLFLNKSGQLDVKYTHDGLHLNADGYKIWVNHLKENKYLD